MTEVLGLENRCTIDVGAVILHLGTVRDDTNARIVLGTHVEGLRSGQIEDTTDHVYERHGTKV